MSKLKFHNLGNADSCLVNTSGRTILIDYANTKEADNDDDKRVDLPKELDEFLEENDISSFDAVLFTHADNDHIKGFADYFYLEHADKYQSDERKKINELWVPAAVIVEKNLKDDAKILRAEARHRLKEGERILIFSKPDEIVKWMEDNDIDPKEREHLFVNAGDLVPSFSLSKDSFEVFVHSPFKATVDEKEIDRNDAAVCVQFTFNEGNEITKFIAGADITHPVWSDIVNTTKHFGNEHRLEWDIFKISHHCSYLSLSDEQGDGDVATEPVDEVEWLFEQGNDGCVLVSSSKEIPDNDDDKQPPHRQAAKFYKKVASKFEGDFIVTMENPKNNPQPTEITIDEDGATLKKRNYASASVISSRPAPRAG